MPRTRKNATELIAELRIRREKEADRAKARLAKLDKRIAATETRYHDRLLVHEVAQLDTDAITAEIERCRLWLRAARAVLRDRR